MTNPEQEMTEGYTDGWNPDSPEPSANRSHSYRHGFANGRADREGRKAFGSVAEAVAAADQAMKQDRALSCPQ